MTPMFLPFAADWKVVLSCCSVTKSCPILCNPWAAACQFPLFFTISWSLLKYISIESMMPFDHVILCCPFSFCLQSFPVLSINIQDWFPLGLTGLISLKSRDSQESSPAPQFKSINSSVLSLLYGPALTSVHDYRKNHSFVYMDLLGNI